MSEALEEEILSFVQTICRRQETSLANESSLFESQRLDSMNFSELLGFLETRYQIKVRARDMIPENFDTIQRLAKFIRQLQTK